MAQTPVALAGAHARPQAPQLPAEVCKSVSQPSVSNVLQSPNPVLQVPSPHVPMAQTPVALAGAHACPQAPQLSLDVRKSVSQPLAGLPSQSPKFGEQTKPHPPAEQTRVALVRLGQAVWQVPQWSTETRRSVSQPLVELPSQSPKPALHLSTVHAPAVHAAAALGNEHAPPHAPQ
jgi:hypothetical protein